MKRITIALALAAATLVPTQALSGRGEHWRGSAGAFGRGDVEVTTRHALGAGSEVFASLGGSLASSGAPRLVWPGAGTGRTGGALLRGHPLAADGAIRGEAFGPRLAHATLEYRVFSRFGPIRAGGAMFVDGARVWYGADGERTLVDPGVGLFRDAFDRRFRLDLARGDDRWVWSARFERTP